MGKYYTFFDNFHRADNPTNIGNGWQSLLPDTVYGIQNFGPILTTSLTGGPDILVQETGASDVLVEISGFLHPFGSQDIAFALRATDFNHYLEIFSNQTNILEVVHNEFGGDFGHVLYTIPGLNTASKIGIQLQGSIITVFLNGVSSFSSDLAVTPIGHTFETATMHGFTLEVPTGQANLMQDIRITSLPPYTYPTSKKNALASFYQYVNDNVLSTSTNESLFLGNYEQAIHFPCIAIVDKGAPDLSPSSFDDYLGQSGALNANQYGRVSQTVVEVNIMDKLTTSTGTPNPDAEKNVLLARERFRRAIYYAGQLNNSNQLYYPNIVLFDYDVNPRASTGSYVYWPSEESNTWFESTYFANADDPLLKRIHIAMRLRWLEIQ